MGAGRGHGPQLNGNWTLGGRVVGRTVPRGDECTDVAVERLGRQLGRFGPPWPFGGISNVKFHKISAQRSAHSREDGTVLPLLCCCSRDEGYYIISSVPFRWVRAVPRVTRLCARIRGHSR